MDKKKKATVAVIVLAVVLGFVGYMLYTGGFVREGVHFDPDGEIIELEGDVKQTALNYNALGFRVVNAGDDMCLATLMLASNIGLYSEGAVDEGKEQGQAMLGAADGIKENYAALSNAVNDPDTFSFSGLFADKKLSPTKEFTAVNRYFGSYFETADFYDFVAVKDKINQVASTKTKGAIPVVLEEIRAQHKMIFVSGYRFEGSFTADVGKAETVSSDFMGTVTEYFQIDSAKVKLYEDDAALYIGIPMDKGYEYELVMSKSGDIGSFTLADIKRYRDSAVEEVVALSIPVTRAGGQYELKEPLKAVGFDAPFTKPGLTVGMNRHTKLKVDKIDQNVSCSIETSAQGKGIGKAVRTVSVDKPHYYMITHNETGFNVIVGKKTK